MDAKSVDAQTWLPILRFPIYLSNKLKQIDKFYIMGVAKTVDYSYLGVCSVGQFVGFFWHKVMSFRPFCNTRISNIPTGYQS